jgi:hypothetical protein
MDLPNALGSSQLEMAPLSSALTEMLAAYPGMLQKVDTRLAEAIDGKPGDDSELRDRADYVSKATGDLRLEGFALRLKKRDGSNKAIEGILALAMNKPPQEWTDLDVDGALVAVADLSLAFRKAEALISVSGREPGRESFSVVIGSGGSSSVITKNFEVAGRDKQAVSWAADNVLALLRASGLKGDLLLAALARAGSAIADEKGAENA